MGNLNDNKNPNNNSADDVAELKIPLAKANLWFSVIWSMTFVDIVNRYTLAACMPMLKAEFNLTDTQLGMLYSVFAVSVAVLAIPISMVAFKWSRRKVLSLMVAVWSLATLGSGMATGYLSLAFSRFMLGVGEAAYTPVSFSLITIWYPKSMRGLIISLYHVANQIAATVGLMLCGWVAYNYGWRASFAILCIPGLVLAVLGWFMPDFKNKIESQVDKFDQKEKASSSNAIMKEAYLYSLKTPSVLFSVLLAGFVLLGSTAISIWGVTLYTRTYGMNVRDAAVFVGYIGIATAIIPILVGKLADVILKKRQDGRLIAGCISACIIIAAVCVFTHNSFNGKDLVIAFICFGLLKGFIMGSTANANALTNDLVPAHYRTITNSLLPLSQQGIGGVLGPLLCGIFSDRVGLDLAFMYVILISCSVQLVTLFVCKLNLKKDLEKYLGLGKVSLEIDK